MSIPKPSQDWLGGKSTAAVAESWPRLSVQFPTQGPRACARCSSVESLACWREHDGHDKPEEIFVILCEHCSAELIEKHPRFYACEDWNKPRPGAMATCENCRYRARLKCNHENLIANGGEGLSFTMPKPITGFIDGKKYRGPFVRYTGPVKCAGKKVRGA